MSTAMPSLYPFDKIQLPFLTYLCIWAIVFCRRCPLIVLYFNSFFFFFWFIFIQFQNNFIPFVSSLCSLNYFIIIFCGGFISTLRAFYNKLNRKEQNIQLHYYKYFPLFCSLQYNFSLPPSSSWLGFLFSHLVRIRLVCYCCCCLYG